MNRPIPKNMKAVVYRGVDDLRVESVPVPRIGKNEILVQVAACGVCPTDIKKIHQGTQVPPRIYGHETAGTIVKAGAGVRGLAVGDRVAKGSVIGYVGTTGNASPKTPHLHFQVMKRGRGRAWWDGPPINPFSFFAFDGIRP